MDFLGMGWPEILVVAIVAIIVLGPDKLPVYARKIGKYYRKIKKMTNGVTKDLKSAILEDEDGESITDSIDSIKVSLQNDADDLRRSIQEDLNDVNDSVSQSVKEANESLEATSKELNNSINDIDDIDNIDNPNIITNVNSNPSDAVNIVADASQQDYIPPYDPMAEFNKPSEE